MKNYYFRRFEFWDWLRWIEILRISVSADHSCLYGGAKEVENFEIKIHSGPEGSRGWHWYNNYCFAIEFIWYTSPWTSQLISVLNFYSKLLKSYLIEMKVGHEVRYFQKSNSPSYPKIGSKRLSECNFYQFKVIFGIYLGSKFVKMKLATRTICAIGSMCNHFESTDRN